MTSVLQDWVMELPLKFQSVLIAAVRGCDNMPKQSSGKPVGRALRASFLRQADPNDMTNKSAFMHSEPLEQDELDRFLKDLDHHPIHYVTHLAHACEIVGYEHPDPQISTTWRAVYFGIVQAIHLLPESRVMLWKRLGNGAKMPKQAVLVEQDDQ